tara:strand:- start:282 stop:545 length:264 start_codon:yes stop_codon:yes gene_type:complete
LISDKKPIINTKNINTLNSIFSLGKKNKQAIRKIKPPDIGINLVVANDLCGVNFLSNKICFFFEIKFIKKVTNDVNKITLITNILFF